MAGLPCKPAKPTSVICEAENLQAAAPSSSRLSVPIAAEVPISFRYNDFPHAVMMATPDNIEDFAFGFSLTEGIIQSALGLKDLQAHEIEDGVVVDINLDAANLQRYLAGRRVRQLRGHTSCGLCGVEDVKDLRRPSPRICRTELPDAGLITTALTALRSLQPLSLCTRGAHAAAWVRPDGTIQTVREDVGRHNALDKLIGAGLRNAFSHASGFCLITSRCSYEMVQKAAMAGFCNLVSASAPTALAVQLAQTTGLTLCSLSRDGTPLLFTQPAC